MNTTAKGDRLENKLYEIIKNQIERDDFLHYKKSSLTLYKKRKYYSDDKDGDVVFDIVLEVSNPKQKANQKPHITIILNAKIMADLWI